MPLIAIFTKKKKLLLLLLFFRSLFPFFHKFCIYTNLVYLSISNSISISIPIQNFLFLFSHSWDSMARTLFLYQWKGLLLLLLLLVLFLMQKMMATTSTPRHYNYFWKSFYNENKNTFEINWFLAIHGNWSRPLFIHFHHTIYETTKRMLNCSYIG